MAKNPTTVRLNAAAAVLKLEAEIREIAVSRRTDQDRRAINSLQEARENLTHLTDNPR
jgi:hypothetical protein